MISQNVDDLLEEARERWKDTFKDLQDALRESEIITEEDLSITITITITPIVAQ